MKATIKESVNSTLIEFQSHIISSVEGMMALQLEQINKSIATNIKTAMESSQMIKKQIPKLSTKTIKKISSLQRRQAPANDILNNITPTQNNNTTTMHENESNFDFLTQYENNIASSNLQIDSDDLSWDEENNSLEIINDMIVDDDDEEEDNVRDEEEEDEDDLYTKVEKEKRGKKDNKKINKKSIVSKSNKPQTRLGSKKP